MNRHRARITDCMDCWQHKHCFLFYENWRDDEPRGIWLCSDCIDRRPAMMEHSASRTTSSGGHQ